MKRIDRYIAREVLIGSVIALLVLVCLIAFFSLLGQLAKIDEDYGLGKAAMFVLLSLPQDTYEMIPTAVLLGGLMSMGAMASHSELVVMRAAGMSVVRITRAVLLAGVLLMAFAFVLGEFIAPPAERYAQTMRSTAQTGFIRLKSGWQFWARDGDYVVNIDRLLQDGQAQGITLYEYDADMALKSITRAPRAEHQQQKWQLYDAVKTIIDVSGIRTLENKQMPWQSSLAPQLLEVLAVEPYTLSVAELSQYIDYRQANNLETTKYQLAFWTKLITPISSLIMLILAMPFVFGGLRSTSAGPRILVGILLGLTFYLLNKSLNHVGVVYGLPPLLSAALPTVLFGIAGILALRRIT